jgi:hypothetical protein
MIARAEREINKISNVFRKIAERAMGPSPAEKDNILRVLSGDITQKDVEDHEDREIKHFADAAFIFSPDRPNQAFLNMMFGEIDRQKKLTQEQRIAETLEDAIKRAKELHLIPSV